MHEPNFDSYPPMFRQNQCGGFVDNYEPTKHALVDDDSSSSDPLPTIDLEQINQQNLEQACTDLGIFRVVNHGIPMTLIHQLHDTSKYVFSLDFESKQALFTSPVAYFWGTPALTPSGLALQRPQNINCVEGFNVPLSRLSELHSQDPLIHSFRVVLEEYGRHQTRVATTLFQSMVHNLSLGPKQYNSYMWTSTGLLRVYRYPQCGQPNQALGMDVHTDSSLLSIINQDEVGGLQFLTKDTKWANVKPIPNTLVVHLGDMMQAISDDKYKSVKHRVKVKREGERISIGYFVFPEEDGVITSKRYKPFTYNEFRDQVQHDVKTLGFKVGLDRFKAPT